LFEWKKNIAQVVSLIVGSGLIVSGFNSFYNDFYNKPRIDIQINPPSQNSEQTVVITNEGRIPATNFFLTLMTPQDMVEYPNYPRTFSTLNETEVRLINPTLLQVGIPKFPHGEGSLARINLRYNVSQSPTIYPEYIAYITYDQGSSKIFIGKPWTLIDVIFNFWITYWFQIATIAVGIYILLIIFFLLKIGRSGRQLLIGLTSPFHVIFLPLIPGLFTYYLGRHGYKRAEQIHASIIQIRQALPSLDAKMDYSDTWDDTEEETRRRILRYDSKAYDLIASLYSMLHERYKLTASGFMDDSEEREIKGKLDVLDPKIREKCNEVINNIDWKDIVSTKS
jgi:hypothetical protein